MAETDIGDALLAFGVLGPFEATYAGRSLPLGGRQQRAILAVLVCESGHAVSVERLIHSVWGEPAPPGAVTSLQSYVFRLRQVLEPQRPRGSPWSVLVTAHGGYRLEVDLNQVDMTRFARLIATGDAEMGKGEPERALATYRSALSLWRGEPLADLSGYDFTTPLRVRLNEMRVSALQARIQALLDLGHHARAVAELSALIADHPLHEQFHAQRILALYRSGRQSDALAAYHELRNLLDAELGIQPSPPLWELNNRVLMQDPALAWRPPTTTQAASPVPGITSSSGTARTSADGRPDAASLLGAWRRRRLLPLAVAGAVVAVTGIAMIPGRQPPGASAAVLPNAVSELDESGSVVSSVPVGTNPVDLTASRDAVWVVNAGDDSVSKVNPATHAVQQELAVGDDPRALTVTGDDVWVTNFADGTVSRINVVAARVVQTLKVGSGPAAIAAGPAGLWVANSGDNTIQQINVTDGIAGRVVDVGDGPDGLAVDDTSVWVANGRAGSVMHIEGQTGQQMSPPVHVGSGPRGIIRSGDDDWVADELSQSVTRISVATGRSHSIDVGDGPNAIAALGDSVWVTERYSGDLVRIDADTGEPHPVDLGAAVHGLRVAGGHLWVTSGAFASPRHSGGTLRIAAGSLPGRFSGIDPARIYDKTAGHAERIVYDGLLAYHYSSADPLVLVPDLATSVPEPTDGGRTYIFTLRSGIKYSTGTEVKASDLLRGAQRALLATEGRPDFYAGIVGGQGCIDHPASCDLRRGVVPDDSAGRLTFHLTKPDPLFLYKLTLLVVPAPSGTPMGEITSPLPGTGPYRISSYVRNRKFALTRNTFFREWSAAAQPAGFTDGITWVKVADAHAAADAVQQRRADLAELTPLGEDSAALGSLVDTLNIASPARVHSSLAQFTAFGVLNSSLAPFDNRLARRAFNYAVDRRKAVELMGGPSVAKITCQLIPPTMPSYEPYCPYTKGSSGNTYRGPDLSRANDLVTASGTRGMKVTVTDVLGDYNPPLNVYFAQVLRTLGYRVALRRLPLRKEALLYDLRSGIQVGSGGWIADFPLPSSFYEILSCTPPAGGYPLAYCNRRLDRRATAATVRLQTEPGAALRAWTAIDREVTDDAPLVPVVNPVNWWVTSERVGNYQSGVQLVGPLLSQLWIR